MVPTTERDAFISFCSDLFKNYYLQEEPLSLDIFKRKSLLPKYWVAHAQMWFSTELFLLLNRVYGDSKASIPENSIEFFRQDFLIKLIESLKREMQEDVEHIRNRGLRWKNLNPAHGLYNAARDLQLLEDAWGIDYFKLHTEHIENWKSIIFIGIEEIKKLNPIYLEVRFVFRYIAEKLNINLKDSGDFEDNIRSICTLLDYSLGALIKKETESAN